MSDDETGKIGKRIDRLIMGIILGGAIGSVLGLTLAPKKGEETRKIIKDKSLELLEKGKKASHDFMRDHTETIESARYQMKKGHKGFLHWLFRKKSKDEEIRHVVDDEK